MGRIRLDNIPIILVIRKTSVADIADAELSTRRRCGLRVYS